MLDNGWTARSAQVISDQGLCDAMYFKLEQK